MMFLFQVTVFVSARLLFPSQEIAKEIVIFNSGFGNCQKKKTPPQGRVFLVQFELFMKKLLVV